MLLKAKPKTEAIQLKTMTLVNQTSPFCSKSHGSAAEKQFRDFHIMFVTTMVPSIETPVTKASALSQFRILNVSCWVSDSLCHIFCHQMFSTGTHVSAYQCHTFLCSTWLRSTVSTRVSATPKFQIFTSCVSFTLVFGRLWHSHQKKHERTLDMDEFVTTIDSTLSVHHRGSFSAICPVPILASAYTGQMSATNLVSPAYLGLLPLLLPTCLCHLSCCSEGPVWWQYFFIEINAIFALLPIIIA